MKRRVLLVDDEIAVLLTLKAVLEINGFDVDTAASAREGRSKVRNHEYHMIITDMKMESDKAGAEVVAAARTAPYRPAVALLTAFPVADEDWQEMGADHMLVKPMHTRILLEQINRLMDAHTRKLEQVEAAAPVAKKPAAKANKAPAKKTLTGRKPIKSAKPVAAARKRRSAKAAAPAKA